MALLLLQSMSVAFTQTVTWEMHQGLGTGIFTPPPGVSIEDVLKELVGNPQHGDSGGFQYAEVPPADDPGWGPAPVDPADGELCFRVDQSEVVGFLTALDFTYFQTTIRVSRPFAPFVINFTEVDDGVRAYVFNEEHPEGAFIEGGDARLYFTPKQTDLSSLFVEGDNRIVLVQFDDAQTANYLKVEIVSAEDLCDFDTSPPQLEVGDIEMETLSCITPEEAPAPDLSQVVVWDFCDPEPSVSVEVELEPVNEGAEFIGTQINWIFTATDASGNTVTVEVPAYFVEADRQPPVIAAENFMDIQGTVNVCNEFPIDEDMLGLTASDNCSGEVEITITILNTMLQPIDKIEGPGFYIIQAEATDEAGNESLPIRIFALLEPNPAIFSVMAGDDTFDATAGTPFTFSVADILMNDAASDGSALEIQSINLVNPADGTLTDNGDDTFTFTPSAGFAGQVQLTYIVKSEDESLYFEDNQHFYEYVQAPRISWTDARAAAEARSLNGLQGYLATVTSQEENDFILTKLGGWGWMGASDAEEEGIWKWVTGPEAGMEFWMGLGDGIPLNNMYSNWDTSLDIDEPNNFPIGPEGEDYGHFYQNGTWNDYPDNSDFIAGYVVEYSGPQGCVPPNFTAIGNITITYPDAILPTEEETALQVSVSPNPFRSEAKLSVSVAENSPVNIEVRDLRGQLVQAIVYDAVAGSENTVYLQRDGLNNGIYLITVISAAEQRTIRAVITR